MKMAQYRDGAKFVRGVVDKVGMADFNAVWERPEQPALARPRSPTRQRGSPGCYEPRPGRRRGPPAPYAGRLADVGDAAGPRRLQRRRRLARAARRHRLRGPQPARGGSSASPSTTACRPVPRSGRERARRRRWRRSASTRPSRPGARRGERPGPRGRGPRGALRRAGGGRRTVRVARRAARPHPRRPGRDGAARADPRQRAAARSPACAPRSTGSAGRCSTSPGPRPRPPAPRRVWSVWTRPPQRRPGLHPFPDPHRGDAGPRARARPGRGRGAGPDRRPAPGGRRGARRPSPRRRTPSWRPTGSCRSTGWRRCRTRSGCGCCGWPRWPPARSPAT